MAVGIALYLVNRTSEGAIGKGEGSCGGQAVLLRAEDGPTVSVSMQEQKWGGCG